jgi:hypothetical protein
MPPVVSTLLAFAGEPICLWAIDCPKSRPIQPPDCGQVIAVPKVGGLQHHYEQVAA